MTVKVPYQNLYNDGKEPSRQQDTTETLWDCIFLIVFSFLPVACVIMGATHLDQCPVEKQIPIYLLVLGIFAEFYILLSYSKTLPSVCGKFLKSTCGINVFCDNIIKGIRIVLVLFLLSWTIAGTVWIAMAYPPEYIERTSRNFCVIQLFDSSCASVVLSYFCLLYITVKYFVSYLSRVYTGNIMIKI